MVWHRDLELRADDEGLVLACSRCGYEHTWPTGWGQPSLSYVLEVANEHIAGHNERKRAGLEGGVPSVSGWDLSNDLGKRER